MTKIDTASQFANQHPHYASGSFNGDHYMARGTGIRSIPQAKARETMIDPKVHTNDVPLQNITYNNVEIDRPVANEEKADFCTMDEQQPNTDTPPVPAGSLINNLAGLLSGISKKEWLALGGITATILIFRNNHA